MYRAVDSDAPQQWLYSDGCWLLLTWLSGCRGLKAKRAAVAVLRLRAPLDGAWVPDGMHARARC